MLVNQSAARKGLRALAVFAHRNPTAAVLILAALIIAGLVFKARADADAFARSPKGVALAAQQREAERANEIKRRQQFTIDLNEDFVRNRLRDPASAVFLGTKVVKNEGKEGVCGFVNAKNGFGGMSGNESFAVIDMAVIMASDGPKALSKIVSFCNY